LRINVVDTGDPWAGRAEGLPTRTIAVRAKMRGERLIEFGLVSVGVGCSFA
jgi:hypothetical protein